MDQLAPARLLLIAPGEEKEFPLETGYTWAIGRNPRSYITLADQRVSRDHAIIQRTDATEYYLIDMGSLNGSYVNDNRVSTPALLRNGDRLSVGGHLMEFQSTGSGWDSMIAGVPEADATQAWFVQRLLTVLVIDVRDFTRLSQRLDEVVLSQTIGTWFRWASEIMRRHGVWALKYIGDAVMATWLHTDEGAQELDVLRILSAVVEFANITGTLEAKFQLPLSIRIGAGINTGHASVGNTGTRTFTDYTAMGDTVNAAFRLESATKVLGSDVVLGSGSYEALTKTGSPEQYFHSETANLKGYDRPVTVWCAAISEVEAFLRGSTPERTLTRPISVEAEGTPSPRPAEDK